MPVRSITQYVDNKKESLCLTFHPNRRMSLLGKFKDDKLTNKVTLYDKQGYVYYKGEHLNTIPTGEGVKYHDGSTDRQYIGNFKNGVPDGENIRILNKLNSTLLYKGQMRNGMIEGLGKRYNPANGKLRLEGNFANGLLHGENCKVYDRNGKVLYQGGMDKNRRHGEGVLKFNLEFLKDYKIKKKYGKWAYALLWGLSTLAPAGLLSGVAWRFSLLAAELTSYGGLAAFLGISSGTIGTLVMALNNIKFGIKTQDFEFQADTQKRLIYVNCDVDIAKNWLKENKVICLKTKWDSDKMTGKFKEIDIMDFWAVNDDKKKGE